MVCPSETTWLYTIVNGASVRVPITLYDRDDVPWVIDWEQVEPWIEPPLGARGDWQNEVTARC